MYVCVMHVCLVPVEARRGPGTVVCVFSLPSWTSPVLKCFYSQVWEVNLPYWHARWISEFLHSSLALMPPASFLIKDLLSHLGVLGKNQSSWHKQTHQVLFLPKYPPSSLSVIAVLYHWSFTQFSDMLGPIGSALGSSFTESIRPMILT